jgi:hypothetical protein
MRHAPFGLLLLVAGCASHRHVQAPAQAYVPPPPVPAVAAPAVPAQVVVEHGRPHRFLDMMGRIFGAPDQLLLWNRRVNNHAVSPHTEAMLVGYLQANDLPDVLVRVNQYAPRDEWRRLKANKRVGAGWRYTVGTLEWLLYTLVPGRLIGDDWYNPFTNTIHVYSDVPAIVLHEAAYSKNIHSRRRPGTYAVIQYLPIVGMWYRTDATCDVLAYIKQCDGRPAESKEAEHILFPMYGGALGGQIGTLIPIPFMDSGLTLAGTAVGPVMGRLHARKTPPAPEDS